MKTDIAHIAVKVENLESFSAGLLEAGFVLDSVKQHDEVGLRIAFLSGSGSSRMELLEVIDPSSPIAGDPLGLHHLCIAVPDIHRAHAEMSASPLYTVEGPVRQGARSLIYFFRMKGSEHTLYECAQQESGHDD